MKYVVIKYDCGSIERESMFVFPNEIVHEYMAAVAKILIEEHGWKNPVPVSAGEISHLGECGGRSSTLNLDSRGERDSQLWFMQDYGGGIL